MKIVFYDELENTGTFVVGCLDDDVALSVVERAKRCGTVYRAEFVCGVSRFGDCAIVRVVCSRNSSTDDFVEDLREGLKLDDIMLVEKQKIKDWYEI